MKQLKLFTVDKAKLTFEQYNEQVRQAQIRHKTTNYKSIATDVLKAYLMVERDKK